MQKTRNPKLIYWESSDEPYTKRPISYCTCAVKVAIMSVQTSYYEKGIVNALYYSMDMTFVAFRNLYLFCENYAKYFRYTGQPLHRLIDLDKEWQPQ